MKKIKSLLIAGSLFLSSCSNINIVEENKVYKSAQLDKEELKEFVNKNSIRTIINLRGVKLNDEDYIDEKKIAERLNIKHYDIRLSASSLPTKESLLRIIEIFESSEYPIYFHCKGGADRSGLIGGIYKLLIKNSMKEAREQLAFFNSLHLKFFNPKMDYFFDLYEKYSNGKNLKTWVKEDYSKEKYSKD